MNKFLASIGLALALAAAPMAANAAGATAAVTMSGRQVASPMVKKVVLHKKHKKVHEWVSNKTHGHLKFKAPKKHLHHKSHVAKKLHHHHVK